MAKTPMPVSKPEAEKTEDRQVAQAAAEQAEQHAADVAEAEAEEGTIPARILVDHGRFKCNTLALLTEAQAANCADWADTSDEAVAYVTSLED